MEQCTWCDPVKGGEQNRCPKMAQYKQISKDGIQWAHLCEEHADELHDAMEQPELDVKLMLRNWVRAGGGSKVMSERMVKK